MRGLLQNAMKLFLLLSIVFSASFLSAEDDLLLGEGDDLLTAEEPKKEETKTKVERVESADPHAQLFAGQTFPSANQCATCHQQIYQEWRSSNHAYASISPMFHKFEQRINDLTQGSINNFCVRCHASVGTTMGEPREMPLWERSQVGREGVTCVTCHRVKQEHDKVNGMRRMESGDIHSPVYGPEGGEVLDKVLAQKDFYKVAPEKAGRGVRVHAKAFKFETISQSEFCVSCHQVAVHPGIKLEVVWDQYRASDAFNNKVSCQDCHMGKNPGRPDGYATGPAAIVNGKKINPKRKHANHAFWGPGYPIAHPGIFPHNTKAAQFGKNLQWELMKLQKITIGLKKPLHT